MQLPRTADIVIIGGGVLGTSIAMHLTRMDAGDVVLLERTQLAAGATGMSSGLVRMHYDNPLEVEIAHKSFDTFLHFDDLVGGECGFVSTGFLRAEKPHNVEKMKANVAQMQALGVNTRLLNQAEIRDLAPYLDAGDVEFAAYEPLSGYADPHGTTLGFANAARRRGARILQGVEATGIEVTGGRIKGVRTGQGDIAAPVVINAAGPWAAIVAARAGIQIDLEIVHHQVAVVEDPQDMPWPHLTVIDRPNSIYLRPETGRHTLVGASHDNRIIGEEELDSYSTGLNLRTRDRVLERLCTRIPGLERGAVHRGHAGIYPRTRDGHALLGESEDVAGFYFATGCSGHAFKEAPVIGQALAELVLHGEASVVDLKPLRPSRFREGQPYTWPTNYT